MPKTMPIANTNFDQRLAEQAYAYEKPCLRGVIKAQAADFKVTELMSTRLELSGEGEHVWFDISKTGLSSERVGKELARHANVAYRDVGYSGMKDVHAVTRQWFSVWVPKNRDFDGSDFSMEGVRVHSVGRHGRKIKRGTHNANAFVIRVVKLSGDMAAVEQRLQTVKRFGVPNYFGEQRFGRNANNLEQALNMFKHGKRIKNRQLRGLLLSSARSYVFNRIVCERVRNHTWQTLLPSEPAALEGSNSTFLASEQITEQESERLTGLDIHPTAPMWGRGADQFEQTSPQLAAWENQYLSELAQFCEGLERNGLEYQRRAIRCIPHEFSWSIEDETLELRFSLNKGHFATSVLREIVQC